MNAKRRSGPRGQRMKKALDPDTLRTVRAETLGWTQAELSEKAGIGKATVGRAEAGLAIRAKQADLIEATIDAALGTGAQLFGDARTGEAHTVLSEENLILKPSIWTPNRFSPTISASDSNGAPTPIPGPSGVWFDPDTKTLWRMRRSKFVSINDWDLRANMGRLRRIEVPEAALEEAAADLLLDADVYEFLREIWAARPAMYESFLAARPALRQWVQSIWAPLRAGSKDLEQRQLAKFFLAMQAYRQTGKIDARLLPRFAYESISCWRIFVQTFPESIGLLEAVSADKNVSDRHRMAVSLLSSTLATTDDSTISSRARGISARLRDEVGLSSVHRYSEYQVIRQFLFGAVEAEAFPANRLLDFLHRHSRKGWEFLLNRGYYNDPTDLSFARSAVKKCERPLPRDERTRSISEYHRNLLPKGLVDEVGKMIAKVTA
jgi:transcriptional regulator with XRE-family HTH domain